MEQDEHLLFLVQVPRKRASSLLIADFLNHLFKKKKLSAKTIEGYKTAIADFLRFHTEENFSDNIFLNKLIKAPWPKNVLTWKRIFLVTMALAARSSEEHALSFADLRFEDNYKFAVLFTIPEFQSKTDKLSGKFLLYGIWSEVWMRIICCALKTFRARTNSFGKKNLQMRRLFISYIKGFSQDICKNMLADWIRSLIN